MKTKRKFLILLVLSAFLIMGSGCAARRSQTPSRGLFYFSKPGAKVPPGQMKKATGAKSAKAYAPGQNKKHKKHKKK